MTNKAELEQRAKECQWKREVLLEVLAFLLVGAAVGLGIVAVFLP